MKSKSPKIDARKKLIWSRRAKMRYFYPKARRYGVSSKVFSLFQTIKRMS